MLELAMVTARKVGLIFFLFAAAFFAFHSPTFADGRQCHEETVSVAFSPTDPTQYHIKGWLCWNGSLNSMKTVQVTIPGGTYTHVYWDFPFKPLLYSYTLAANAAGYATFNFDKLGSGQSDYPTPEDLSVSSLAFETHQIVQDLKNGSIEGTTFSKVILVGHSIGSETAIEEAGNYQDVDGVILTGHLHNSNPAGLAAAVQDSYPSAFDPQLASRNLPLGYLTTMPGTRGQIFYNTSFADPQVIAIDEQTKDVVADGTLQSFLTLLFAHTSNNIHVPVFVEVGEKDSLTCPNGECTLDFVKQNEAGYYSPDACPHYLVMPNSGHDLQLHFSAPLSTAAQIAWANLWVGNSNAKPQLSCGE